jgi:hypothetical protein
MTDRELTQQALWALKDLIAVYPETACIETRISAQKVIAALEAKLAKPEQPDLRKAVEMAVPLLIGYREYSGDHRIANRCGEVLEALRQALAQPEFDTPESHIVKWSIPVDPNNFGEPHAQPEHPLDKKAANARDLGLDYEPEQEELIQFKDGKWSYVRKPWVGLTEDEILSAAEEVPITCIRQRDYDLHFAPIIEAKLKEKNT